MEGETYPAPWEATTKLRHGKYVGVLGREVSETVGLFFWCPHSHRSVEAAQACAERMLRDVSQ